MMLAHQYNTYFMKRARFDNDKRSWRISKWNEVRFLCLFERMRGELELQRDTKQGCPA